MISLPARRQFNSETKKIIEELFEYYDQIDRDFGTRGEFENRYKNEIRRQFNAENFFVELTVSGTVALHVILQSLPLKEGDEVLTSPITDPGAVTPVILNNLKVKVFDLNGDGHISLAKIQERVSPKTKAIIINHLSGVPVQEIKKICDWCVEKNIYVIEDSSQAHGAKISGEYTGTFGDVSFFSTMFSKNHSSGGTGGIILTKHKSIFEKVVLHIHKGKPIFAENFNEKDPANFQIPALNLEMPEICSAIGISTLKQLEKTNQQRNQFLMELTCKLKQCDSRWQVWCSGNDNAPYFGILKIPQRLLNDKNKLIEKVTSAGLKVNGHYPYIVTEWPWMQPYLDAFTPVNAIQFRNSTMNLLFNENYDEKLAEEISKILNQLELNFD